MKLAGEQKINATREVVFAALNDPEILQQSIPGCEEIIKISDTEMTAVVTLKIGPVKAKFKGSVELSNLNPPDAYTISGEGKAGPAGSARGGADVLLLEDGDGTILKYDVSAVVMGKFAQLGNRLIDSTAKRLAAQFFESFAEILEAKSDADDDTQISDTAETGSGSNILSKPVVWAALAVVIAAIIVSQLR